MKFVSIPYNDFIYEIFIYEMLCEIFVRAVVKKFVFEDAGHGRIFWGGCKPP
jgi:hypothetical protein